MSASRKRRRLLVIGLDGVALDMLVGAPGRPSLLPGMCAFFAGRAARLSVSIPEISAVSWSSFMTGTQPGEHGIFGFVDLEPGSYHWRFPDFRDLRVEPFFIEWGRQGLRSVIINLPATYPARPIPGVLISGFVALELERAVFPSRYLPMLRQAGYQVDVDAGKGRDRKAEFLADLHCALEVRKQVADRLWQREDWDIFMFTVTGTDRLQHFLYDAYRSEGHEHHEDFVAYFRAVDEAAVDFLQRASLLPDTEIIALSDHGFGNVHREIYLNQVLKRHGFLSLAEPGAKGLAAIGGQSSAFALDPSRLYVHRRGKYPRGSIAAGDWDKVRRELKDLFSAYEVDGQRAMRRVFFAEEIYSGAQMAAAPDLVLLSEPGFDLKGGLEKEGETGTSHFSGMHLQDNAFLACSRPELLPAAPTIFDVKGLMRRLLAI